MSPYLFYDMKHLWRVQDKPATLSVTQGRLVRASEDQVGPAPEKSELQDADTKPEYS